MQLAAATMCVCVCVLTGCRVPVCLSADSCLLSRNLRSLVVHAAVPGSDSEIMPALVSELIRLTPERIQMHVNLTQFLLSKRSQAVLAQLMPRCSSALFTCADRAQFECLLAFLGKLFSRSIITEVCLARCMRSLLAESSSLNELEVFKRCCVLSTLKEILPARSGLWAASLCRALLVSSCQSPHLSEDSRQKCITAVELFHLESRGREAKEEAAVGASKASAAESHAAASSAAAAVEAHTAAEHANQPAKQEAAQLAGTLDDALPPVSCRTNKGSCVRT